MTGDLDVYSGAGYVNITGSAGDINLTHDICITGGNCLSNMGSGSGGVHI